MKPMPGMRRREFVSLFGSAAAAWPVAVRAQPAQLRQRRLGVLLTRPQASRTAEGSTYARWLEDVGWKATANLDLEIRWATGNEDDLRDQVADIASLSPDVILVESAAGLSAMRQAAPSIPIVFIMVGDPVGSGFVKSLAHPGGSITGFTNFEPSMGGKWLEVLKEIAPSTAIVAVLLHPDNPLHVKYWNSAEAASQVVGVRLRKMEVRGADDIERAFARLPTDSEQGLIVFPHFVTVSHRKSIIGLAGRHRIPAVYGVRFFATDGGLISYGVDSQDLLRRAFGYVDRIFRGASPSDLPVQARIKFDLAINLKSAKAIGLDVPPALLARADEVIE
jgi:putative tryptophan/tyrosine transport system substrate-binding protein